MTHKSCCSTKRMQNIGSHSFNPLLLQSPFLHCVDRRIARVALCLYPVTMPLGFVTYSENKHKNKQKKKKKTNTIPHSKIFWLFSIIVLFGSKLIHYWASLSPQQVQSSEYCALYWSELAGTAPFHPARAYGWRRPEIVPERDTA